MALIVKFDFGPLKILKNQNHINLFKMTLFNRNYLCFLITSVNITLV